MGYSCRADASDALARIATAAKNSMRCPHNVWGCACLENAGSNAVVNAKGHVVGFFERGRENADGAITGTVMRYVSGLEENSKGDLVRYGRRAGSFRISPDGEVERFPLMAKAILAAAKDRNAPRTVFGI